MNQFEYCSPFSPVNYQDGRREPPRRQAALNASSGGVGPLPIITTLFAEPLNVVSTPIDTTGMGKTNNLLNFTSIVNLPLGISVTLNFEITRSLNGGAPVNVGATYTFSTVVDVLEAEAFSFQFFDPDVAPGFYTYSVQLSTNSVIDITPGAAVQNAVLSVLAVAE
ncbi:MAG: DUF4489 domain-containing protein [Clostridiales bacterium]|jgi:hypothetical protein|nr:DUF4489 domain-containing protein [Clostridiales bacterium]